VTRVMPMLTNEQSMELDDHCSSEPLGTIAVRDNDIKPSTAISSSFARHSTVSSRMNPIGNYNIVLIL
jgi:hypothetical protein